MENQLLHDFLINQNNEENKQHVVFIIPSGVLQGRFKNYDHKTRIVTISNSMFSSLYLDTELSFPMEIIQAWGKK